MPTHQGANRPPGPLARAWDTLLIAIAYLMATLLGIITAVVLLEVAARYFFNRPTVWAVDFTEYALVYLTLFGAAWALRERAHVRVDMLLRVLSPHVQLALTTIVTVAAAGVIGMFVWKGAVLVWEAFVEGQTMLKAWAVPRWIILLPIPVASLLMVIEFLRQAWEGFQSLRHGRYTEGYRRMQLGAMEPEDKQAIF